MGPPKIAFSWFISGWILWVMVDITIVNGDYFMVYKPTFTSLGGCPSCRCPQQFGQRIHDGLAAKLWLQLCRHLATSRCCAGEFLHCERSQSRFRCETWLWWSMDLLWMVTVLMWMWKMDENDTCLDELPIKIVTFHIYVSLPQCIFVRKPYDQWLKDLVDIKDQDPRSWSKSPVFPSRSSCMGTLW